VPVKANRSKTDAPPTGAMIIHLFLAVFGFSETSALLGVNAWNRALPPSVCVFASSDPSSFAAAAAAFGAFLFTGVSFVDRSVSGRLVARLIEPFAPCDGLVAESCCLAAGGTVTGVRGVSTTGDAFPLSSGDGFGGAGVLPKE
jgi:hypothetical protein